MQADLAVSEAAGGRCGPFDHAAESRTDLARHQREHVRLLVADLVALPILFVVLQPFHCSRVSSQTSSSGPKYLS